MSYLEVSGSVAEEVLRRARCPVLIVRGPVSTQPDRSAAPESGAQRESGQPGGGQGRIDEVGWSGVYPGSGPYPEGPAEIRTPGTFVHGQRDAEGRQVEGGSEIIYYEGDILLGGATPSSSSPPETREVPPAEPAG